MSSNILSDTSAYLRRKMNELNTGDMYILIAIFILLIIIISFLLFDSGIHYHFFSTMETFDTGASKHHEMESMEAAKSMFKKKGIVVLVIHDKNCPHCVTFLEPNGLYDQFADHLKQKKGIFMKLVSKSNVRSFVESKLPIDIDGYPTILALKFDGKGNIVKHTEIFRKNPEAMAKDVLSL